MSLFGNVSKRFRETVDETVAQKKAEAAARKKLSEIETIQKVNSKAKTYTRKGLSIDEARVLAKTDVGKEKAAERSKKLGDSMKGLESALGSSFGDFRGAPATPKKRAVRQNHSKSSSGKSVTINISESKKASKRTTKKKNNGDEPNYMSVFRN